MKKYFETKRAKARREKLLLCKSSGRPNPNKPQFNIPARKKELQLYFKDENCRKTPITDLKIYTTEIPNRSRRKLLMGNGKMPSSGNRKITKARKKTHMIVNKVTKTNPSLTGIRTLIKKVQIGIIHIYNTKRI